MLALRVALAVALLGSSSQAYNFSVWAPHASAVSVAPVSSVPRSPEGPHYSSGPTGPSGAAARAWGATAMQSDGKGSWAASVAGVQPGDGYAFQIQGAGGDKAVSRIDPRCADVDVGSAHSIVPAEYTFRNGVKVVAKGEAVVYELHVGSFSAEGTFDGASKKLGFLADLGVTVVELMPVTHACGDPRGWGYCPRAYFAVRPELGGALGLKRFVDAAAQVNIAVAIDLVLNHASGDNLLERYDTWAGPANNGVYFYQDAKLANTPWGPRPDFSSAVVRQYLVDSMLAFAAEFHVSAFRFDSTSCIRLSGQDCSTPNADGLTLLHELNVAGHAALPGLLAIAEDTWGKPDANVTRPLAAGGVGFDSQWGYPWHFAVVNEVTKGDNTQIDVAKIAGACAGTDALFGGVSPEDFVIFSGNHDVSSNQHGGRIPARVGGASNLYWAEKKALILLALVFTCRGTPMLLQGQEVLTLSPFDFPVPPPYNWSRAEAYAGILQEVRDLAALRRTKGGAFQSNVSTTLQVIDDANDKIAVLLRSSHDGSSHAVVVYNFRKQLHPSFSLHGLPVDGTWQVGFNGDAGKYSPLYDNACSAQTSVSVSGGAATICLPPVAALALVRVASTPDPVGE